MATLRMRVFGTFSVVTFSTVASGLNALAANLLSDILQPWYKRRKGVEIPARLGATICKCIGLYIYMDFWQIMSYTFELPCVRVLRIGVPYLIIIMTVLN